MDSMIVNEIDRQMLCVNEIESLTDELNQLKKDSAFLCLTETKNKEKIDSIMSKNEEILCIIKSMYVRQMAVNKLLGENVAS